MERFIHRGRDLCFVGAVLFFLFAVALATLLLPKQTVSGAENRTLAETPSFSEEEFFSGEYFLAWEDWLKDHIVARDPQLYAHTWLKLHVFDRTEVNGILTGDGALLPDLTAANVKPASVTTAEAMADEFAALNELVKSYGGTLLYVGVPTQMTAFADRFPEGAVTESETRAANGAAFSAELEAHGVAFLDMHAVFAKNGGCKPYYMRTDHHYNLKGAELVYRAICETISANGVSISAADLSFTELDLKLLGSRNRAIYYLSNLRDAVYLAEPIEPVAFTRTDNGKKVAAEVFRRDLIDNGTVTYSLYMGGDIGETVIATDREDLPDVLLFGDSYTNAVETLLYLSCDELRTLDLRHYKEMTLTEYVERYHPDVVICLRDDNNYLVDTGNGKLR